MYVIAILSGVVMTRIIKKIIKACLPYGIVMLIKSKQQFPGTISYWEKRYAKGGTSGAGSYNALANFKAEVINEFIKSNKIQTIIEFGCGDGNQLSLAEYPNYTGFDVSRTAIQLCKKRFKNDTSKNFFLITEYHESHKAELVLSLDVIYHLIEDNVFKDYITHLFRASTNYVIIYACNFDGEIDHHERPRKFTKYIEEEICNWKMIEHRPNKYPYDKNDPNNTSRSDFFIYAKIT
jgi:cyclopropane fatty-acyl-phospholipid synthase-like methyltransferase